jgi:catechol 2,3-dioxygenase-like lactoylglutathione lyase family enzyme
LRFGGGAFLLQNIDVPAGQANQMLARPASCGVTCMKVKRIVANLATEDVAKAKRFYHDILGLDVLMDHGWLVTYGSAEKMTVQVGVATQGGSETPVPDLSIEVDDVQEALARIRKAKIKIEYGPADEPWNVRRFYVRDPFGKLVNILMHK